ncbi:2-hydroxychromene-2-carboxylate isomerase [Sphingomonas sp. 37zxx]|uniref:2-hydroxychromene-2-carboxylate isomerase n=1 Tax=Sphingomonas sp. 37zxx TaxID=1550073 RepID=UPI00053BFF47|nr:DsbA family protein [Sphingomonas sp. 37zxx]
MTLTFDLYWSFRSPYSYLVTQRLVALEAAYDVRCNVRIVYPIAVRQADFFAHLDPLWVSYLMRDIVRTGEFLGIPIRWPVPDPVVMDFATRTYPAQQPHIHRLSQLGQLAAERGCGLAFIDEVSRVIWDGSVDQWHEGDHLTHAAARAGLELTEMDRVVAAEHERLDSAIKASQDAQRVGGHYGVPLMVFAGEPFFGQDRFDQLKWRLEQAGLARR